nr:protein FAR1-RELATED SEQUENCE 5-like [Ipomoea batatas]
MASNDYEGEGRSSTSSPACMMNISPGSTKYWTPDCE